MKRKISDLMDHLPEARVDLENNAPLSPRRLEELTMSKITNKETKPRRIAFRLLAAAAIIAVMAMTIFAAEEIMTYDNWFEDYFSGKEVIADISENTSLSPFSRNHL